jgi:hypothetical protein
LLATATAIIELLSPTGTNVMFGIPPSRPSVVVSDPAAMVAVVTPPVRSDLPPVDVDPIVLVDVDIDVAAAPVAVSPTPKRWDDGRTDPPVEA